MNHKTCTHCTAPIPSGLAVIRSQSFQRVAYHQECYAELRAEVASEAPVRLAS